MVFFDKSLGQLAALFRFAAVIADEQLYRNAAQPALFHINGQLKTVPDLLAEIARLGGQGGDHADLHRLHGHCRQSGQDKT